MILCQFILSPWLYRAQNVLSPIKIKSKEQSHGTSVALVFYRSAIGIVWWGAYCWRGARSNLVATHLLIKVNSTSEEEILEN